MSFKWDRVNIWSAEISHEPGSIAATLSHMASAGANLEYIYSRPLVEKPGRGILYVAPITGPVQSRAAHAAGLVEVDSPIVRRIEGDNEAGLGHRLTQQWAKAGISLQGLTMAVLGDKFVGYAVFESIADANKAAQILADLGSNSNNDD